MILMYKKLDNKDFDNYCLIILLSNMCELFLKALLNRVINTQDEKSIISEVVTS